MGATTSMDEAQSIISKIISPTWSPQSGQSIDTFLCENKRLRADNPLGVPWVWVDLRNGNEAERDDASDALTGSYDAFIAAGAPLVSRLTNRVEEIQSDDSIPVRKSKKAPKSKADCRKEEYERFRTSVRELAINMNLTSGKWIYRIPVDPPHKVNDFWDVLVKDLAAGDDSKLAAGGVKVTKISASPTSDVYICCVYCENSYDKGAVGKVLDVLLKNFDGSPTGFKTDAFTILGINSGHPSKIEPVSLYSKSDFYSKDELAAIAAAKDKGQQVKQKTAAEEKALGGGDFVDSEDEAPPAKKAKMS